MAATPATVFGTQMTKLTGNTGGAVEALPNINVVGAKERVFVETLTLASQTSTTVIGVARLPLYAVFLGVVLVTDTSLGSSTIAFGDAGNGNSAIYAAAATLTATDTPTTRGKAAVMGVPITSGFDCVSGLATGFATGGNGGALYEDIILTVGAATMPASGTLTMIFKYAID